MDMILRCCVTLLQEIKKLLGLHNIFQGSNGHSSDVKVIFTGLQDSAFAKAKKVSQYQVECGA